MPGFLNRARRLVTRAALLSGARSGNVTILFALSLLPMVGLLGYGVDYGVAITDKAKLDAAADAAAIAAVASGIADSAAAIAVAVRSGRRMKDPIRRKSLFSSGKAAGIKARRRLNRR